MPTVLWQAPATARISKRAKSTADKHNRKRTQRKLRPFWHIPVDFSALGVDMKKSANVMSIAPKTKTRCTTAAFATSAELYSAAKARGNRQATLQPVGTKKQHIRSRRILAFRSATVSTCRSRIFLFQLFSSTSMRISRGCSKRKTAILTNNEAKK